jgi:hypothetical protein
LQTYWLNRLIRNNTLLGVVNVLYSKKNLAVS